MSRALITLFLATAIAVGAQQNAKASLSVSWEITDGTYTYTFFNEAPISGTIDLITLDFPSVSFWDNYVAINVDSVSYSGGASWSHSNPGAANTIELSPFGESDELDENDFVIFDITYLTYGLGESTGDAICRWHGGGSENLAFLAPVPEPSTTLLMACGGLVLIRKKLKKVFYGMSAVFVRHMNRATS